MGVAAGLFQGCAATGAVGVAATALSIAAGVAAPKNPGQIEIDPNKSLKDKLRGVEKGATAVCRLALNKPSPEAVPVSSLNIPKGCEQRRVCLRGALKPIVMLVCQRGDAPVGQVAETSQISQWNWKNQDSAEQATNAPADP